MAGTGLIAIRRRIKSITNTKKITKAMGLVATSKLRKVREVLKVNNNYFEVLQQTMQQILQQWEEENTYLKSNKNGIPLYIVLTSDMGLCGAFNGNVIQAAVKEMKKHENFALIVVGQKGRNTFRKLNIEAEAEYVELPSVPSIEEAAVIAKHILELYKDNKVNEVHIIYTHFISQVKQEVEIEQLLPIKREMKIMHQDEVELQLQSETFFEDFIKLYLDGKILNLMLNAKASEQRSRMESMDGATKNANEILEKLNLKYNRIRQSAITQEISEIVGGAEAQK